MFPIYRYTALPYSDMEFVESSVFERYLPRYLSDDEFGQLQLALKNDPTLGVVIPRVVAESGRCGGAGEGQANAVA